MNLRPWIPAALLLLLTAATAGGWLWTREAPASVPQEGGKGVGRGFRRLAPPKERLVDQSPLFTARSLVPLAHTIEEQQLARQAERLANHEVDLAFADALRRAVAAQVEATPEIKELAALKAKFQAEVDADRKLIERLTRQLVAAPEAQKDALEDQLEVAKAQLGLDEDELEAASEDLARAGGDPQARIRRLKEAHEAADRESAQAMAAARESSPLQGDSLLARLKAWRGERSKLVRLAQARQEALAKAQALADRRVKIEERAKKEKEEREAVKYWASNLLKPSAAQGSGPGREQAQDAVSYLKQYAEVQRRLADMGRRVQDQRDLAEVYGTWMALADGTRNAALHRLLERACWILGLLLAAVLAGRGIDQGFQRAASGERKAAGTFRAALKVALFMVTLLAVGFLVLGLPAQPTTVFGLAGAGLTVALKDFIVAFFGWFVLMGKNGIRVGDWVEIRGVGGEVVEIGLLRTVVLETGSWSDAGHPTGRRVAFVNNFAIEGHFFNFSTRGQWMWDELKVLIPQGQDPYPVIDGVQRLAEQQTEANARAAEQEWRTATARYRVATFSATPGLNVVPTAQGVEIRVRYITRAFERHDTRLRLNQAVLELLHGPRTGGQAAPDSTPEAR